MLTGGFSEVNRAQRVAMAQAEFREALKDWPPERLEAYIAKLYPAYWLKVDLPHKIEHANFVRAAEDAGKTLATTIGFDAERAVTELTVLAPDHPWLLSIIAGACAMAGANIVDAQIYTTTDGRALDTISLSREFERDEDEQRRANRIADSIEKALRGELRLPDMVGKRAAPKGRIKAFALEPTVTINNQWSHRYTMVEVTGLDRTGLLYELTTTLSKLNLNIASAHVATFGERVVDVFYVTDLMGAQITSPTRQAAIKRALIALFAAGRNGKSAAKSVGLSFIRSSSSSARRKRRMMTPRARSSAAASIRVVDVEDQLRHVVVPIERDHRLGRKPAAVRHVDRRRRRRGELINVVENRQEDLRRRNGPLGDALGQARRAPALRREPGTRRAESAAAPRSSAPAPARRHGRNIRRCGGCAPRP